MVEGRDPTAEPSASPRATPPLTERINAAYASSGPVLPDEPAPDRQPTAGERFAAALAAARSAATGSGPAAPAPAASPTPRTGAPARPARPARPAPRRSRRVHLRLTHIDPWSVMKTAFLLSIALAVVSVVAIGIVWLVIDAAGVFTSINQTVGDVVGDTTGGEFRIEDYLGMSRVMGFALVVAVLDVVLVTVIATLGAFLYNLAAALLGGLEVTLAEEDR